MEGLDRQDFASRHLMKRFLRMTNTIQEYIIFRRTGRIREAKPDRFEDMKSSGTDRPAEESTEGMVFESESDSEENEREIRYAEILNRRKIILEGPPGTGKTYAIEGIVDELRSRGIDVEGDGEGEFAITMHPATSYEDFIEGLRPIGNGDFGYKPEYSFKELGTLFESPQAACHTFG